LHEGIERAAQSVLGDENEALRRARDAVDQLAQALDEEIDRASGTKAESGERKVESGKPAESGERKAESGKQPGKQGRGQQGEKGQGQTPGKGDGKQPGGSPGAQKGGQPAESQGGKPGTGGGQEATGAGEQQAGSGQQAAGSDQAGGNRPNGSKQGNPNGGGGFRNLLDRVGGFNSGPLTGGEFRRFADGLRDVEEMLNDPQLRAEAARIRDRASAVRAEFKRHSKEPNWELVRETISKPLAELRQHLAEELLKQQSKDALVPLDRDPVPPKYSEQVRRYYERLGSGR
jgi:hypothetical protein